MNKIILATIGVVLYICAAQLLFVHHLTVSAVVCSIIALMCSLYALILYLKDKH